jgi:linoleoyl-CoA desaturase
MSTTAPLETGTTDVPVRSNVLGDFHLPLTEEQIEEFGRELDAIRDEVFDSRGERDRRYILALIRTQRAMALGGRLMMLAGLPLMERKAVYRGLLVAGGVTLGLAKVLENMEIAHNVLHAQWDWMKDPNIQSSTWEWDAMGPSDRWMNSHNVEHHTWTNVVGRDLDVGYGILRMTPLQPWKPRFLLQPLYAFLLMNLFDTGVSVHEHAIIDVIEGRKTWAEIEPLMGHIRHKMWRQIVKDFIAWPTLAAVLAIPIAGRRAAPRAFIDTVRVNALANWVRNIWSFSIIFCGHFPSGTHNFTEEQVAGETRPRWYLRQMLASANIKGSGLFHIISGNLSHQIEHHLFPDMCSNRYPEIAPRVRALADRYEIPYNTASFARQIGSTWLKIVRLAVPSRKKSPTAAR